MMLTGRERVTMDDKGRMPVPARFREELKQDGEEALKQDGKKLVLSYSLQPEHDKALKLYTLDAWQNIARRIENLLNVGIEASAQDARRLQRYLIGGARQLEIDEQGRVLLPKEHRDAVGITKKVVLVAIGKALEIWPAEKWDVEFSDLWQVADPKGSLAGANREAIDQLVL